MKQVTAAVIIEGGRLMLARRPPGDPLEGLWELPGGKIEAGETPQSCLERELLEELDMSAKAGQVVAATRYTYDHGSFEMIAIVVERQSEYKALAHDAISWVRPRELGAFQLAPADVELIAQLRATQVW